MVLPFLLWVFSLFLFAFYLVFLLSLLSNYVGYICMQEYTVQFITRLMSPPVPADFTGSDSHLIDYASMLNVLIVGIASVDCVQIFSLHGLV